MLIYLIILLTDLKRREHTEEISRKMHLKLLLKLRQKQTNADSGLIDTMKDIIKGFSCVFQ